MVADYEAVSAAMAQPDADFEGLTKKMERLQVGAGGAGWGFSGCAWWGGWAPWPVWVEGAGLEVLNPRKK
jgi:hypothetical protein